MEVMFHRWPLLQELVFSNGIAVAPVSSWEYYAGMETFHNVAAKTFNT